MEPQSGHSSQLSLISAVTIRYNECVTVLNTNSKLHFLDIRQRFAPLAVWIFLKPTYNICRHLHTRFHIPSSTCSLLSLWTTNESTFLHGCEYVSHFTKHFTKVAYFPNYISGSHKWQTKRCLCRSHTRVFLYLTVHGLKLLQWHSA
jgi:hypothetical protein